MIAIHCSMLLFYCYYVTLVIQITLNAICKIVYMQIFRYISSVIFQIDFILVLYGDNNRTRVITNVQPKTTAVQIRVHIRVILIYYYKPFTISRSHVELRYLVPFCRNHQTLVEIINNGEFGETVVVVRLNTYHLV